MVRRWHIKKGDNVVVTTGKDKGKVGEVISVLREKERILVRGINICKRHQRQTATTSGGIVEKESSIHISNVMHTDPKTDKPTRVGIKFLKDGRKARYAKSSGELIDK